MVDNKLLHIYRRVIKPFSMHLLNLWSILNWYVTSIFKAGGIFMAAIF